MCNEKSCEGRKNNQESFESYYNRKPYFLYISVLKGKCWLVGKGRDAPLSNSI